MKLHIWDSLKYLSINKKIKGLVQMLHKYMLRIDNKFAHTYIFLNEGWYIILKLLGQGYFDEHKKEW